MNNNEFYCVVFDNDPEKPGVLQVCLFEDEYGHAKGSVTKDKEVAENFILEMKVSYPEINYQVMKAYIVPLEEESK